MNIPPKSLLKFATRINDGKTLKELKLLETAYIISQDEL